MMVLCADSQFGFLVVVFWGGVLQVPCAARSK